MHPRSGDGVGREQSYPRQGIARSGKRGCRKRSCSCRGKREVLAQRQRKVHPRSGDGSFELQPLRSCLSYFTWN